MALEIMDRAEGIERIRQGHSVHARRCRSRNRRRWARVDEPDGAPVSGKIGLGNFASAALPDIERYFRLRSM